MIDIEYGLLPKLEVHGVITRLQRIVIKVNLVAVAMIVLNTPLFCEIEL